ncbi:MFS transporter [Methylomonas paludis]|uniref:MFS transporter n=1 Tax=Methylomonas paludis TaxID=1173101 RepID=A0A975R979_9GAMM|nr:MFS transporter [Methylomonas paludis]QWF69949.1 MFS transporter [Methylomonas paludis]
MAVPYWRLSAFYACYFAILGSIVPFWSLYLKHVGFNPSEIGQLTALIVATKIIAPNLWGWLADKTGRRLRLIRITSLLSAALFCGFLYRQQYWWFAGVTVAFSFFWNASLPQFEAATLFHLQEATHRYSRIRLWGSLGFIAAVLGIGQLLDTVSIAYLPYLVIILLLLNWLLSLITPEAGHINPPARRGSLGEILRQPEVICFFLVYMLLQVAHGPYYVFFSVYLKQHGYSASFTGQLWALGVCAEIVMFLLAGRLLRWFSVRGLLLSSLLLSTVRWLLIAYAVDSLEWLLIAQLLHAASFGITHVVAMQLLLKYFGASHQGKGQAFYSSLSFGCGGMIGSLYSGYLWDSLGGSAVFVIAAGASALAFILAAAKVARIK